MLLDRVSNPGPLTYESGALPIALRGPAIFQKKIISDQVIHLGISGVLKVRFLFCKAQLVRIIFLYPY